jgi:hypothetical protein
LKQNIIFQRNDDTCKAVLYEEEIKHVSDNILTLQNYIWNHYLNRSVKVQAFFNMKYLKLILCNSAYHITVRFPLIKIKYYKYRSVNMWNSLWAGWLGNMCSTPAETEICLFTIASGLILGPT